ncbi:MAG: c-type cytochrome [Planctomycetes bacterium]|nr:c-type cytochrome [Planctomycetia bacterium]MBI3469563.1 c-type cytochrome [Planctomycetota bacterium]
MTLAAWLPVERSRAADPPAVPHWIWLQNPARQNETAFFRKEVEVQGKVKSAQVAVTCDNQVSLFVNGKLALQHDTWEQTARDDIAGSLVKGKNAISARCRNADGPGAFLFLLVIETDDGKKTAIISDDSWLASGEPRGNWREINYDAKGWQAAVSLGKWGMQPWGKVSLDTSSRPEATAVDDISVLPGFKVERVYSVPKGSQGSWVSMTPDPKGRLIVSAQEGSLYRVTPGKDEASTVVEKIDVPIGQAQGLLCAFGDLYVTVNGSAAQGSGLYRVRDTNGDDKYDQVELLKKINGGGEHGPHAIRLGPDGYLYVIAGNHTKLPDGVALDSPHRNYAEDLLLPRNPDGNGHATGVMAPGGWICRTDKDGKTWTLFCAGFRNEYDIDFNQDGELFTYDADMEWDTGTPWYRPTRVNHAVSAAEFGWRYGTGKWPDYSADSLGAVVNIGLGSPTGVTFGTGARFPAKYQRAFFISDWTYGKLYAVHVQPNGAGYTGTFEAFCQGKPLPLTDVVVSTDGAMYFTIGGRGTQSGLYRITYTGNEPTEPVGPVENKAAAQARAVRQKIESFHGKHDPAAIETAWPYLNSSDRNLRYAARVAVEQQEPGLWREKAFAETRITASIQAMVAVTRLNDKGLQSRVLEKLNALPFARLTEEQFLEALRVYQLAFIRLGGKGPSAASVVSALNPLFPNQSEQVSRELCQVLVYLEAPGVIGRGMEMLRAAQTQQDQLFYVFVLRNLGRGWSLDERRAYFSWLNLAESKYQGGASFKKFIQRIREDALKGATDDERAALREILEGREKFEVVKLETTRQFLHNWQMEDLEPLLSQAGTGRSFERGLAAYQATQCAKCHRFKGEGGDTGPDITGVGNRFDARYMLEALIDPSKVVSDQYKNSVIQTTDGEVIKGRILSEDEQKLVVRTDPFARTPVEVPKSKIDARELSPISEMPQGLINVLTKEEILDLIAYMRAAGDPSDKAFQKK